jgi:hypothetical protein
MYSTGLLRTKLLQKYKCHICVGFNFIEHVPFDHLIFFARV